MQKVKNDEPWPKFTGPYIKKRVPQGTVLAPLLFLLFISMILRQTSINSRMRLFADDCLVHRVIKKDSDCLQLQEDISLLCHWVVPENTRTPTMGGIEILPPQCVWKFQNALPPTHSEFQTPSPPPSLSEFQRCFQPVQNFLFNLLNPPPPEFFFGPLKKMWCILLNLNS